MYTVETSSTQQTEIHHGNKILKLKNEPADDGWRAMDNIVWPRVFWLTGIHVAGLVGLYMTIYMAKWETNLFTVGVHVLGIVGITVGYHRMWAHKSYRARWPFRLFYATLGTIAYQQSVYVWARDHRLHHKFSETNYDPHNPMRSVFYSHIGCLMSKKHPKVVEMGKKFDLSDLKNDWVVHYQRKYYNQMVLFLCVFLPTVIPWFYWNESLFISFFVCVPLRIALTLNSVLMLNSWGHRMGDRPLDKNLKPGNNRPLSIVTCGEGNHHFHHVFPWDWTGDIKISPFNLTTWLIKIGAALGMVYHVRRATPEMIEMRRSKNIL